MEKHFLDQTPLTNVNSSAIKYHSKIFPFCNFHSKYIDTYRKKQGLILPPPPGALKKQVNKDNATKIGHRPPQLGLGTSILAAGFWLSLAL